MTYDELMENLKDEMMYAEENFVPIIRPNSAKFLHDFVKNNNIKSVFEVGTAIGFSGTIMLNAGVESLLTVDINEKSLAVAENTFSKLGYKGNVKIINNDAKVVIRALVDTNRKFDMIFLDGAKGQYIYYLPSLVSLLNEGGYIFADNVLLQGMVESEEKIPHRKRTMVVNLRKYLDSVFNDNRFESKLIRIEDGISISKYKGE